LVAFCRVLTYTEKRSERRGSLLDGVARRLLGPALDRIGGSLARRGVSADRVTTAGFVLGLAAAGSIAAELYWIGLAVLLASRLCDGLDGAVARHTAPTDRGGFLDIVLDFAFYGAIPLAFAFARPDVNALPTAALLFSFYVNGASFLAYAAMAERRGLSTEARGRKSLYFTTGLAEATETVAVFAACCVFPDAFPWLAYGFALLTLVTAVSRIALAIRVLG
jgi:phosphatidylglycerophosphate synthase